MEAQLISGSDVVPFNLNSDMSETSPTPLPHAESGHCLLADWGVIEAQGEDAARFLHGQFTQDVLLLPVGQARLAAYCSAKGRMQASFWLLKVSAEKVLMIMPKALIARTVKRLSMFVLRAKVRLHDASEAWMIWGLLDALDAQTPAPASVSALPEGLVLQLHPAMGQARALSVQRAGSEPPAGPAVSSHLWTWLEVRSGVGHVSEGTFEAFVPQMLNYESLGGVNFKKGCYPGQEVVARSQFRGTLKRRAFIVHSQGELVAGNEVFNDADREQPCGVVAQSAPSPNRLITR